MAVPENEAWRPMEKRAMEDGTRLDGRVRLAAVDYLTRWFRTFR